MGKIDYFSIFLNKPNPIFLNGEPMTGSVNLRVRERLKINSIYMVLQGKSRVLWYVQIKAVSGNRNFQIIYS